jgi:hypothetical protein
MILLRKITKIYLIDLVDKDQSHNQTEILEMEEVYLEDKIIHLEIKMVDLSWALVYFQLYLH